MARKPAEAGPPRVDKPILAVLQGERRDPPPVWMMRQAGRYLPEYRQLRHDKGSFLELVYDSDAAAEITLQPLERFPGLDAAIIFSDILIVPFALGQNLTLHRRRGPAADADAGGQRARRADALSGAAGADLRDGAKGQGCLHPDKALVGFAGSPWTVATYMVAGQGSRDQSEARRLAYADPGVFADVIGRIEAVTLEYLLGQIRAGAEAVQLFDSWAGSLSPTQFEQWVIAPTARLVAAIRSRHPGFPVIGFPKGAGGKIAAYARETDVTALGLDETIDPAWAAKTLPADLPVQGNLDPLALLAGGEALRAAVQRILDAFAGRPHIFNLGHGILQETPITHVEELLALVKGTK